MAQTRHLIIDITQTPHVVVDEITFETDPAMPDYETIHSDPARFVIMISDEGGIGWTWSKDSGLRE